MKRIFILALACGLLGVVGVTYAASSDIGDFASQLSSLRDTCSSQASKASADAHIARYQAQLDAETAQTKAQMDAQVYNVGHGDRETRDFMLNRAQQDANDAAAANQKITEKSSSDAIAIKSCVASAERSGKDAYMAFVKRHKKSITDAKHIMSAWLANVDEISFDQPIGTPETAAAWKAAKADAEVSSL